MEHFRKVLLGLLLAMGVAFAPASAFAKDHFVIDLPGEPSSLDPHQQWNPDSYNVYRNIFDNLLTRDNEGEIAPQIATEWEYLSDTKIRFKIRDDVTFHNGTKLTADDVVYSVKRITAPEFGSPQLGQFDQIIDAVSEGETTVVLTTDGPYPPLFAQLVKLSIVPQHLVEEVGDDAFNLNPVGSGPYVFENWQRGVEVTLTRNEDYWGTPGPFETVSFRAVPDAATRVANLQAGASDFITYLDGDLVRQIEASGQGKPLVGNTERVAYIGMNVNKSPFDDKRVRMAVAHAIDKEVIVEGVLGTGERPVNQVTSPAHAGWVEEGIPEFDYDPEKARALLAEVGDKAKEEITLLTAPVYDQRVVQAIQQMLNEVGLNVEIAMTDMATWLQQMQSGPDSIPQMAFSRWSCGCQDADGILYPLLHSSSSWSSINDPVIEEALEAARTTLDSDARLEHYRTVHERVASEAYIIPLYQASVVYGAAEAVEFTPTPNESIFLNRIGWNGE